MRKIISYSESLTDERLVQLIGESENHEPDSWYSDVENQAFLRRGRFCNLLNDIEFTIENYGILNFLIDYNDQITDLKELEELLQEFSYNEARLAVRKTLNFYENNIDTFKYLETDPEDFESTYSSLELQLNELSENGPFYIPLYKTIKSLASHIRENKSDFFIPG